MNDDQHTITSGLLDVGDGHKIYYQEWGNPDAPATFCLHGGPGSQSKQKHKFIFDPLKHHVIFYDQRGSGQSTSEELLRENNTTALVEDIEKLRKHFNYETIQLFGYSWGSTLALCYAIKYRKHISKLMIGGVYLATAKETNYLYETGEIAQFAPEAWEYYQEIVPENEKSNKIAYYCEQLFHAEDSVKLDHLRRWGQLEASIMSFDTDYALVRFSADVESTLDNMNSVLVAAHYFANSCFMPENYIIDHADQITGIPMVIVQGRFDGVCPPEAAYSLAQKLGRSCHLHIVPSSHAREGAMREVLRAYAWAMLG